MSSIDFERTYVIDQSIPRSSLPVGTKEAKFTIGAEHAYGCDKNPASGSGDPSRVSIVMCAPETVPAAASAKLQRCLKRPVSNAGPENEHNPAKRSPNKFTNKKRHKRRGAPDKTHLTTKTQQVQGSHADNAGELAVVRRQVAVAQHRPSRPDGRLLGTGLLWSGNGRLRDLGLGFCNLDICLVYPGRDLENQIGLKT